MKQTEEDAAIRRTTVKDKIREDALDALEEVYDELKETPTPTIPELGRIARIGAILRRAKRYPLSMAEG